MVLSEFKELNIFIIMKLKCFCLLAVTSRNMLSIYVISVFVIWEIYRLELCDVVFECKPYSMMCWQSS
jgi:hypothetical protein